MKFSKIEKRDLFKAWIAITLAFTIINLESFDLLLILIGFIMSGITVGVGFIFHELAHKFLAQRYGCLAEFRSNDQMLIFAIITSFFGFLFVAPGAVFIRGNVTKDQSGKISSAGIFANIVLAFMFLLLMLLGLPFLTTLSVYGVTINSWLAVFNLIPFGNFDGIKVLSWNKFVYGGLAATAGILLFLPGLLV